MTLAKHGINYANYSSDELQGFIRRRSLHQQLKDHLTQLLRDADLNANFRFLDLPPEICNMIYEKVIEVDRSKDYRRRITPDLKILLTCKQIYQEALKTASKKASFPIYIVAGKDSFRQNDVYFNRRRPKFIGPSCTVSSHAMANRVASLNVKVWMDPPS